MIAILAFSSFLTSGIYAQSPISGFNPATLSERQSGIAIDANIFCANDALSFYSMFNDEWDGSSIRNNTNHGDAYWNTEIAAIYSGWRFAGFYRGELFLKANKDSIEIFQMINKEQNLPVNEHFDIDVESKGFSAGGIELSKGISLDSILNGLSGGLTARCMSGERIQQGFIKGDITTADDPLLYEAQLDMDYIYDENYVYDREVDPGVGTGYSFDIGLKYHLSEAIRTEVLFRDILGKIYWEETAFTHGHAASETRVGDEFRPTISGKENYEDFTQDIVSKTDLSMTYTKNQYCFNTTVNLIDGRPLYWLNIGYMPTDHLCLDLGYNTNYQCISAGINYRRVALRMYADNIDPKKASAAGLTFVYE